MCVYIYIYILPSQGAIRKIMFDQNQKLRGEATSSSSDTPNFSTNIMDFRGFDSSTNLFRRGGILMPIGNFPESLSQAILVGIMLAGRFGVESTATLRSDQACAGMWIQGQLNLGSSSSQGENYPMQRIAQRYRNCSKIRHQLMQYTMIHCDCSSVLYHSIPS